MAHIPYGFRIINAELVIHEEEAERVKNLFSEFIKIKSMRAAALKAGINKTHSSIGNIINNEMYLGNRFYPSIIDESVFRKAQEIRKENAVKQNRVNKSKKKVEERRKITFKLNKIIKKYNDPYLQAEYIYSLIREEEANE